MRLCGLSLEEMRIGCVIFQIVYLVKAVKAGSVVPLAMFIHVVFGTANYDAKG